MGTIAFLCLAVIPILLVGWAANRYTDNVMEQQFLSQWDKRVKPPFVPDLRWIFWGLVIAVFLAIVIGLALGV